MKLRDLTHLRPINPARRAAMRRQACSQAMAAAVRKVQQSNAVAPQKGGATASRRDSPYPLRSLLRQALTRERATNVARALGLLGQDLVPDMQAYWGHLCAMAASGPRTPSHEAQRLVGLGQIVEMLEADVRLEAHPVPLPVPAASLPAATPSPAPASTPAPPSAFGLDSGRWDCLHW